MIEKKNKKQEEKAVLVGIIHADQDEEAVNEYHRFFLEMLKEVKDEGHSNSSSARHRSRHCPTFRKRRRLSVHW